MIKETAYETLENIAKIADREKRKATLRAVLENNNALAIIVQRTYHPRYNFDLPVGPLPSDIAKKSGHDEAGPMYNNLRRWDILRSAEEQPTNAGIMQSKREEQFISLYEAVASKDADLLIAVKDKELPWPTLDCEFVVDAVPELFPESFRSAGKRKDPEKVVPTKNTTAISTEDIAQAQQFVLDHHADEFGNTTERKTELDGHTLVQYDEGQQPPQPVAAKSKRQLCQEIIEGNPGLARKDYLALFEAVGVKGATASLYYQQLKSK